MTTAKKDKIYKITIFKTLDIRKQRTVVSQRLETNEVGHRTSQEYYLKDAPGHSMEGGIQE